MALSDDLRHLVDEALATGDWAAAASALRDDRPPDQLAPPVIALIDAFVYGLALANDHTGVALDGVVLAVLLVGHGAGLLRLSALAQAGDDKGIADNLLAMTRNQAPIRPPQAA